MNKKLWFLTKMSLNKKIKSKWFIVANAIFFILIVALANIDMIIKAFGGDFDEPTKIMVIDNASVFEDIKNNYETASKYLGELDDTEIILYDKTYDEAYEEVKEDNNKLLLLVDTDDTNYLKAKLVSKESVGSVASAIISSTLKAVRSGIVLTKYNITKEQFKNIEAGVELEKVVIEDDNFEDDLIVSSIMQVITLPLFMLIMFLIQMIGAEVNEEKSTKSMEIIISNVSPKTHFLSKVIASNGFVLIQSGMLFFFVIIAALVRLILTGGNIALGLDDEIMEVANTIPLDSILSSLGTLIPILIIMLLLTFIAYSLLAGILASMTTNLEDFEQLQTPIVIISLVGYYLSVMSSIFKGSLFIKIMSYIPLISSLLAPTLYVLGEITLLDLVISILLLIGLIYLLIKYGLRIYKVGILNYSGTGLWKKMLKAIKEN